MAGIKAREIDQKPASDPLDVFEKASKHFYLMAIFIYKHFEQESAEKIGKGLHSIFRFLFKKVERFTSGDLWLQALSIVMRSSRNVQQMHFGLLRYNLLWLLLFLIFIVIIVWIGYTGIRI